MLHDFEKDPDEILATARTMAKTLLNEHIAKANGLAINEHNLNPYVSAGAACRCCLPVLPAGAACRRCLPSRWRGCA